MKVLVTGATGFVGTHLCQELISRNYQVLGTVRDNNSAKGLCSGVEPIQIECLSQPLPKKTFDEVEAVVHLAARVHQMAETIDDPLTIYRRINTEATVNLAKVAHQNGVRRFIYLSSIKVNGEGEKFGGSVSDNYLCYREDLTPNPQDAYGQSKWEAEQGLSQLAPETGLEVVIFRPPLVYGPRVKANFLKLIQWVNLGFPFPLAKVENLRSLIYVGNLVDAIITSLSHPEGAGQTFLVSDGEDLSTPELIKRLGNALGKPARLYPISPNLLAKIGKFTNRSAAMDRLLGSLVIDSQKIRQTLNWQPPFTVNDGLKMTTDWYLQTLK